MRVMENIKIMIAEHDTNARKQLAQYFGAQHGIVILSSTENGRDALEQLKSDPPDVLITDLVLPEYDGFALLEEISHTPTLKNVVTIVVTCLIKDIFI